MIPEMIFTAILLYLACGLIFAIVFVIKGAVKVDEGAHDATMGFKVIIIPGTVVFWPLLLKKWLRAAKNNTHD